MYTINRSVAIIRPKRPFVDWANSISEGEEFTIEDLNVECNAVLLPDYIADNYDGVLLEDFFKDIFELELSSWTTDYSQWPRNIDYEEFLKWFDFELHSMVFDSLDDVIERKPYSY